MLFLISNFGEQLSQALRRLRRDWAFTAAFVVTLALGIAANAAVFAALDAYFLQPLPYPNGRRLVEIHFSATRSHLPLADAMSAAGYQQLRSAPALASSGLESAWGAVMVTFPGEIPHYLPVATLTASTLETLGVQPLLGRWIGPAADRTGGPAEVDVGYRLWQSAFHGDAHVLGRMLRIGGKPYAIVGVMPSGFAFPTRQNQLWASAALTPAQLGPQQLTTFNWAMIGRLKPGASQVELATELNGLLARLEPSISPAERKFIQKVGAYVACMPLRQWLGGATRGRLLMMQLGAGILLVLAVASLVNLALARALRRRDETALRVVLGAGRRVLLAQALLEALPIAGVAILVVWPLTDLGMMAFNHFGVASAGTFFSLRVGTGFWLMATAVAFILSGIALALPQTLVHVNQPAELRYGTGKGGGSGQRMRPLRMTLNVGQIALAIALLSGALLLGRSLRNMLNPNPGIRSRHLYAAMLYLQGPQYRKWGAWLAAHQRLATAVAALPGVDESGIGEAVPFSSDGSFASFRPAQPTTADAVPRSAAITQAGPGFLQTLGVHLLAGRPLDANDAETDAPNVIVDERYADALFGNPNVVGKTLQCAMGTCRIVGVVSTIQDSFAAHYASFSGTVFVPEESGTFGFWGGATTILIRSRESPAILAREVGNTIHRILPGQSLVRFVSLQDLISNSARGAAALASLLIAFGLLAFTLAVIGTYGVVAYMTGLRRREFAVRQAVGAEPIQIEFLALSQGMFLWVLGVLVGSGCAFAFARSLAAELYGVTRYSPAVYGVPALVVGAAVMLASWIPAHGALNLDLVAQIRQE